MKSLKKMIHWTPLLHTTWLSTDSKWCFWTNRVFPELHGWISSPKHNLFFTILATFTALFQNTLASQHLKNHKWSSQSPEWINVGNRAHQPSYHNVRFSYNQLLPISKPWRYLQEERQGGAKKIAMGKRIMKPLTIPLSYGSSPSA